jgi:hypothetical protein
VERAGEVTRGGGRRGAQATLTVFWAHHWDLWKLYRPVEPASGPERAAMSQKDRTRAQPALLSVTVGAVCSGAASHPRRPAARGPWPASAALTRAVARQMVRFIMQA